MRTGWIRVVGAAVEEGGITAAALVTDGLALAGLAEDARRDLPAGADALAVETAVAELLARFAPPDLIGVTGLPEGASGAVLAAALGVPVVWDMASADRGMDGQGGPLAPVYLHALARHLGWSEPVAFLDLGALARLVWIDPSCADPIATCLAFDAGPGLPPAAPAGGQVDAAMLHGFVQHPFFARRPPKWLTAGAPVPETGHLDAADAAATRSAATAAGVVMGLAHLPAVPARLVVTGPGRRDPALLAQIAADADLPVVPAENAGIDADRIGAQAAAYLAARTLRGLPTSGPSTTGARAAVSGGVLSRPGATGPGH
jgi:anhydro-N-acetylmuramic acid kinase